MHSIPLLAALAAASVSAGTSFVELKSNNIPDTFDTRNGPLALARSYSKFGIAIPSSLLDAITITAKHTKRALPNQDHQQLAFGVSIGSSGLNLNFDSASADLWVFSTETDPQSTQGHNLYNPSGSSTAAKFPSGSSWNVTYADGTSASGDVFSDTVSFGGLSVQRQAVESAINVSPYFASAAMDGVLGLAFSSINTVSPQKQRTWFENAAPTLRSPIFGADFRPSGYSYAYFGQVPSNFGNPVTANVDASRGLWQFNSSSPTGGAFSAIVDTATSLVLAPNDVQTAYYRQVQGATFSQTLGGWVFDCSERLPSFRFTVGSGYIDIPGSYMVYAQADSTRCYGALQPNGGLPYVVLGSPAMWSTYVALNLGNASGPTVGWTQKVYES